MITLFYVLPRDNRLFFLGISRAWSALKKARALHADAKQHPCLVPDRKEVKRRKDKF